MAEKLRNQENTRKINEKNLRIEIDNLTSKIKQLQKLVSDANEEISRKQKQLNIVTSKLKEKERKNFNTLEPIDKLSKLRQSE